MTTVRSPMYEYINPIQNTSKMINSNSTSPVIPDYPIINQRNIFSLSLPLNPILTPPSSRSNSLTSLNTVCIPEWENDPQLVNKNSFPMMFPTTTTTTTTARTATPRSIAHSPVPKTCSTKQSASFNNPFLFSNINKSSMELDEFISTITNP
eukprot:Pgem_evm1s8794